MDTHQSTKQGLMKLIDRHVLKHLEEESRDAGSDEIHVIYRELAKDLHCGRSTAYRSVNRLIDEGHIQRVAGNHRKGYVYRIPRDN
jgi:predicted transcriptional regulator